MPHSTKARNAVAGIDLSAQTAAGSGLGLGTRVLTLDGEMPVEFLSPGDRIITRDSGVSVLRSVTSREAEGKAMIRISQNSIGIGRPEDDVLMAADQPVLLRDWRAMALFGQAQAMVPASRLVDGQYVRREQVASVRVYDLKFDTQHVIYAHGLELASAPVTIAA